MATVTVYGASDDLIEVEGAINEEWSRPDDGEECYLAFSDGTVLCVEYTQRGTWHIEEVELGSARCERVAATHPDDEYSDRVTLTGDDLHWVVCGAYARATRAAKP